MTDFRFLMISAMYENGGNTTHRFLDGHPQLFVYPFESQPGTRLVSDDLTSMFPTKYRWPTFALHASAAEDYRAILDEEGKVRARTPDVSKFRNWDFDLDDDERMSAYCAQVERLGRSRGSNVEAFFRATFEVWRDHRSSGREEVYVGYSPVIVVDTEKILADLPGAHVLHVVRNPWSAYADTKKRAVPLSLRHYMTAWTLNQHFALLHQQQSPERVHVVRAEDVMADSVQTLGGVLGRLGLDARADSLAAPSFNGARLDEVYPWGTIRQPTPEANRATADELSQSERDEVTLRAGPYLEALGYGSFLDGQLEAPALAAV